MSRRSVAHGFDSSTDRRLMHTAVWPGRCQAAARCALVGHHVGMSSWIDTHCHLDAAEFATTATPCASRRLQQAWRIA